MTGLSAPGARTSCGPVWPEGEGRSLRELHALLPFLHSSELAEAHERGPATAVDVRWRLLREQAAGQPVPSHGGKPHRVREFPHDGEVIGEVATAVEAVALAVGHLPAGLGPTVAGTVEPD